MAVLVVGTYEQLMVYRASAASRDPKRWLSEARQTFGGDPDITWFDCPVVIDNHHDDLVTEGHVG